MRDESDLTIVYVIIILLAGALLTGILSEMGARQLTTWAPVISALGGLGSFATAIILAYLYSRQKQTLDKQAEIADRSNKLQRLAYTPDVRLIPDLEYIFAENRDPWFGKLGPRGRPHGLLGDVLIVVLRNDGRERARDFKLVTELTFEPESDFKGGKFESEMWRLDLFAKGGRWIPYNEVSGEPFLLPDDKAIFVGSTRVKYKKEDGSESGPTLPHFLDEVVKSEDEDVSFRYSIKYRDVLGEAHDPFSEPYEIEIVDFQMEAEWLKRINETHYQSLLSDWPPKELEWIGNT